MKLRLGAIVIVSYIAATRAHAAPPIDVEIATERGVQITAPQAWLQLFTSIGIERVTIRGIHAGDEPRIENLGSAERPNFRVLGVLSARDQLRLPGGTFSRADARRLKDYFARLAADGAESLTAPRGRFALTEKEWNASFADLSQPIEFQTKGQPPRAVIDKLQARFSAKLAMDPSAERDLRVGKPVVDELRGLTAGTGLAMMLRGYGLALRPEKPRGEPLLLRIEPIGRDALLHSTLGKAGDEALPHWPIGWEPEAPPIELARAMFEELNAEIEGYTLEETLAAIDPRIKVPTYRDHAMLRERRIEPEAIQVRFPRTRTTYKRLLDRVLFQARLGAQLRVDEAGTVFLWITP